VTKDQALGDHKGNSWIRCGHLRYVFCQWVRVRVHETMSFVIGTLPIRHGIFQGKAESELNTELEEN
jgi:hypothetical protein